MIHDFGYFPPPEDYARSTPRQALYNDIARGQYYSIPHLLDTHDKLSSNIQNASGESPLLFAMRHAPKDKKLATVEMLASRLEVLVDLADEKGRTPLQEAILNDEPEIVRVLLYWHADPFKKNNDGKSAIDMLSSADCPRVRADLQDKPPNFLLMQGKRDIFNAIKNKVNHPPNILENTPELDIREKLLRDFTKGCATRNVGLVQKTVNHPEFDVHYDDGLALRQATFYGHLPIVEYLLGFGPNIHARDDEALANAVKQNQLFVVELLLACGADPMPRRQELKNTDNICSDVNKLLDAAYAEHSCADEYEQNKIYSRRLKPTWGEKMNFSTKVQPALKHKKNARLKEIFLDACKRNKPWTVHQILKQSDLESKELLLQGLRQATTNDMVSKKKYRNKEVVHVLLEHGADPQDAANSYFDAYFTDRLSGSAAEIKNTKGIMALMEQFGACKDTARDKYFNIDTPEEQKKEREARKKDMLEARRLFNKNGQDELPETSEEKAPPSNPFKLDKATPPKPANNDIPKPNNPFKNGPFGA